MSSAKMSVAKQASLLRNTMHIYYVPCALSAIERICGNYHKRALGKSEARLQLNFVDTAAKIIFAYEICTAKINIAVFGGESFLSEIPAEKQLQYSQGLYDILSTAHVALNGQKPQERSFDFSLLETIVGIARKILHFSGGKDLRSHFDLSSSATYPPRRSGVYETNRAYDGCGESGFSTFLASGQGERD